MKKPLLILSLLLAVSLIAHVVRSYMDDAPMIALDIGSYSAVGDPASVVTGTVTVPGGNPEDYAITMALISPDNGHTYAPKPSAGYPTVPVTLTENPLVGNFTCVFASGSRDYMARVLYVYVVPADFEPDEDLARTRRAALASTEIIRES